MGHKKAFLPPLLLLIIMLVSSCSRGGLTNTSGMQQTAYARTIAAIQSTVMNTTPTTDPAMLISPSPQATQAATPTTQQTVSASWLATNVGDITFPDGTIVAPEQKFTKTWVITNGGSGTWEPDFKLVFSSGDAMSAPDYVFLKQTVAPGQSVYVSVELVAPSTPGTYTGYFLLQTDQGYSFGIGDSGIEPFWVSVVAQEGFAVTGATISTDTASYSGACPVTVMLHAKITASAPGAVTFHFITTNGDLAAETVTFNAAATVTSNGTQLTISSTQDVTISIYIDSPNHQSFGSLTIPVTCSG
jgi:hypothetical protein